MNDFNYVLAKSVNEVVTLLEDHHDSAKILSGGTDLVPQLSEGRQNPNLIIDIKGIPLVNEIIFDKSHLYIGSAVTCLTLSRNNELMNLFPGLHEAFSLIGGIQIQGRATIGGNLCNASPAADSIPALIVHKAECVITGSSGERKVPVEEFCTGPGKNVLQNDEFLVGIQIPVPQNLFGASYQRFIPRNEMDIAIVGVGSSLTINESSGEIIDARIGLGAVAPTPLYVKDAGSTLLGTSINDEGLDNKIIEVSQIAQDFSTPITDMRGSASQRKHLVKILTRRTIKTSIERVKSLWSKE